MQLIFIDTLKSISGYKDLRAIRVWLASMKIQLKRVGRNYAVDKNMFEQQFQKAHGLSTQRLTYTPKEKSEKLFLKEISHLLSPNREL